MRQINPDAIYVLQWCDYIRIVCISANLSVMVSPYDIRDSVFSAEDLLNTSRDGDWEIIQEWE